MDTELFAKICEEQLKSQRLHEGIGTLKEKTIHVVLKNYFSPDKSKHEIKIGSNYADIYDGEKIIEIQTKNFNKLRNKLDSFLKGYHVLIVYPLAHQKKLSWYDPNTGEITKSRLSPKKANIYDCFDELYKIKTYLSNPNLSLCLMLINMSEYRILDGWSNDKKRGSHRIDRYPNALVDEIYINNVNDYKEFLPPTLPIEFTTKLFSKIAGVSLKKAQLALHILCYLGIIKKIGKEGNLIIYKSK
jgi:hypothetical protein